MQRTTQPGTYPARPAFQTHPAPAPIHLLLLVVLLAVLGHLVVPVHAVSDEHAEPLSMVKWGCSVCAVFFVFFVVPAGGMFKDGIDPVIAYVIAWVIMGCWVLYGIAQ